MVRIFSTIWTNGQLEAQARYEVETIDVSAELTASVTRDLWYMHVRQYHRMGYIAALGTCLVRAGATRQLQQKATKSVVFDH